LKSDTMNTMQRRVVQNFLDVIVLLKLRKSPLSAYDVISFVHLKFHMLISSGTVYANLYALERNGLLKGEYAQKKRVYKLTERGKETAMTLLNHKDKILDFVLSLFVD